MIISGSVSMLSGEHTVTRGNLIITHEELRRRICSHYNVEELCDIMKLTPEDIFDQMFDQKQHLEKFNDVLTELDYNNEAQLNG